MSGWCLTMPRYPRGGLHCRGTLCRAAGRPVWVTARCGTSSHERYCELLVSLPRLYGMYQVPIAAEEPYAAITTFQVTVCVLAVFTYHLLTQLRKILTFMKVC